MKSHTKYIYIQNNILRSLVFQLGIFLSWEILSRVNYQKPGIPSLGVVLLFFFFWRVAENQNPIILPSFVAFHFNCEIALSTLI